MNTAQLPRYRSHKVVFALKIGAILALDTSIPGNEPDSRSIVPVENGYAPVTVTREYIEKHKPVEGGYYVVYADGYQSFSPAEAFESGYLPVEHLCVDAVVSLTHAHRYVLPNFENKNNPGQVIQFIEKKRVERPESEGGPYLETVNDGTTNEAVLEMLIDRLFLLNQKFPCKENSVALTHIETAKLWLEKRTADRQKRGVEGAPKA